MNYPAMYQELLDSTEMIRSLLVGITPEQARVRPSPAAWSVLEVVCHLHDEEREDFREHLDFILHRQHEEWHRIDPQSWVTQRNYGQQDFEEMQEKFFGERTKSLAWLKGLSGADWETAYQTNDLSMSAGEMFSAWIAHDNLHVRQLVELRRTRIEKLAAPYSIAYAGEW